MRCVGGRCFACKRRPRERAHHLRTRLRTASPAGPYDRPTWCPGGIPRRHAPRYPTHSIGQQPQRRPIPSQALSRYTGQLGYWLGPTAWGNGYATEALRAFSEYAFEEFDLQRLQATVLEWNPASCRVLEKAGFVAEARLRKAAFKDGQLVDTWLYAKLRSA